MRPVICLITDGRLGADQSVDALAAAVGAAARAGVHLIQIRERRADDRMLAAAVAECVAAVRQTPARVIVNDRFDIALAGGAHGVHLRGDSFPAVRVRGAAPAGFLIGQSVHEAKEAVDADLRGAVDYLIFGSVFATTSKPDRQPAGVAALADLVTQTAVPVLAVGGVTPGNAAAIARAGAAGVAAISLFAQLPVSAFASTVEAVSRAFDSAERGS